MKFSIIVPVYNVAPYLRECLDSLMAQTFADWEAICVDDGSTDGSAAILDDYATRDSRIMVLRQENSGVSAARNRGLEMARGDYLWFVDGDDVISGDSFRILAGLAGGNAAPDIIHFKLTRFSDCADFSEGDGQISKYDLSKVAELRKAYRLHAQWILGSSAIFRREFMADMRFENLPNGEDSLWGRRAFYRARSLVCINRALYGYRQREDGANSVWTRKHWNSYCRVSWLMAKEGLGVKGLFWPVLYDGLKTVRYAWLFRKRIKGCRERE